MTLIFRVHKFNGKHNITFISILDWHLILKLIKSRQSTNKHSSDCVAAIKTWVRCVPVQDFRVNSRDVTLTCQKDVRVFSQAPNCLWAHLLTAKNCRYSIKITRHLHKSIGTRQWLIRMPRWLSLRYRTKTCPLSYPFVVYGRFRDQCTSLSKWEIIPLFKVISNKNLVSKSDNYFMVLSFSTFIDDVTSRSQ